MGHLHCQKYRSEMDFLHNLSPERVQLLVSGMKCSRKGNAKKVFRPVSFFFLLQFHREQIWHMIEGKQKYNWYPYKLFRWTPWHFTTQHSKRQFAAATVSCHDHGQCQKNEEQPKLQHFDAFTITTLKCIETIAQNQPRNRASNKGRDPLLVDWPNLLLDPGAHLGKQHRVHLQNAVHRQKLVQQRHVCTNHAIHINFKVQIVHAARAGILNKIGPSRIQLHEIGSSRTFLII